MATERERELAGSAGGAEPQHCAGLHDMLASALCVMQGCTLGLKIVRWLGPPSAMSNVHASAAPVKPGGEA